jgi:hypothetical protein
MRPQHNDTTILAAPSILGLRPSGVERLAEQLLRNYRLPGGLHYDEVELLVRSLLATGKIVGISVSIFNPALDSDGYITASLGRTFRTHF